MIKDVIQRHNFKLTIVFIFICILFFSKCISKESEKKAIVARTVYEDFAGSESCRNCHKDIFGSHITTPHFLASAKSAENNIKGNLTEGENMFSFSNQLWVKMEKRNDGIYQVAYLKGEEQKAGRFDITFGSGTKGQTFASWKDNSLFQLPITYFTQAHQWCNSPGYPGVAKYNRPVTSRCLECHSTYFQQITAAGATEEAYDKNKIIYGISCEKCHGPAKKHVEYQSQYPGDTAGKFIINPGKLSRRQNLDVCGLCHGGRLKKTQPSFLFQPGDKLSDYFNVSSTSYTPSIDVHGNQYGLLSASKCFINSQMTCQSCHSPHEKERGNYALLSQRCMACHNEAHGNFCKLKDKSFDIKSNCIECHMPKQLSMAIAVYLQGQEVPTAALLRTHYIKVYPEETKKWIMQNKKNYQSNKAL